jgi:hypothetical protein
LTQKQMFLSLFFHFLRYIPWNSLLKCVGVLVC